MDRRAFLRAASLVAAGAVAGDQLELLERLTHRRRLFPGWSPLPVLYGDGIHDDTKALQALVRGERVRSVRDGVIGGPSMLYLHDQSYRVCGSICVPSGMTLYISSCRFDARRLPPREFLFECGGSSLIEGPDDVEATYFRLGGGPLLPASFRP